MNYTDIKNTPAIAYVNLRESAERQRIIKTHALKPEHLDGYTFVEITGQNKDIAVFTK